MVACRTWSQHKVDVTGHKAGPNRGKLQIVNKRRKIGDQGTGGTCTCHVWKRWEKGHMAKWVSAPTWWVRNNQSQSFWFIVLTSEVSILSDGAILTYLTHTCAPLTRHSVTFFVWILFYIIFYGSCNIKKCPFWILLYTAIYLIISIYLNTFFFSWCLLSCVTI